MGCRQYLPLSVVQLKGKHCRKPHCCNGVVDTFVQGLRVILIHKGLNFIASGKLSWSICFWVNCQWNKFEEKAQCDTYLALTSSLSLLTFVIRYIQHAVLLAPPWFLKRCNKENIFLSSSSLYFWLSLLQSIGDIFSPPLTIFYLFLCLLMMHSVGDNYLLWI